MKSQYYPPVYHGKNYHCPRCQVYSSQSWTTLMLDLGDCYHQSEFEASICAHCSEWSFWYQERLIDPNSSLAEPMHHDLPEDCRTEYEEARDIVGRSPRGAAALLRLCLQKLMPHLGEAGENINDDIKSLVGKGLSPMIQQALDICRVVGNHSVHPGRMDIKDTPEIAHQLFRMINFIVEDRISRPKAVQALFSKLPQRDADAIAKRDAAK